MFAHSLWVPGPLEFGAWASIGALIIRIGFWVLVLIWAPYIIYYRFREDAPKAFQGPLEALRQRPFGCLLKPALYPWCELLEIGAGIYQGHKPLICKC